MYVDMVDRINSLIKVLVRALALMCDPILNTLLMNSCPVFFYSLLKIQVAERNKNQKCGRTAPGRSGLLCSMWQKTKAVP